MIVWDTDGFFIGPHSLNNCIEAMQCPVMLLTLGVKSQV